MAPGVPLPPEVEYLTYAFNKDDALCIEKSLGAINAKGIRKELLFTLSNFNRLAETINKLETQGILIEE